MSTISNKLLEEALGLSRAERADLANSLLESLEVPDPEADRLWAEEIARRVEDLETGRVETTAWSEIRAELEIELERKREKKPDAVG